MCTFSVLNRFVLHPSLSLTMAAASALAVGCVAFHIFAMQILCGHILHNPSDCINYKALTSTGFISKPISKVFISVYKLLMLILMNLLNFIVIISRLSVL